MTTPADHTDEAVRDTLRAIGDAAGPAPAFERLTLPDAPVLTVTPDERRPRPALIAGFAAASLAVVGAVAWQLLDDGDPTITDEPTSPSSLPTSPSEPSTPTTPPSAANQPGWARLPTPPLSPRTGAIAVWTGTEVIVAGGGEAMCHPIANCVVAQIDGGFSDGAAFDPSTSTWRPIADAPVPLVGADAVAVDGDVYVRNGDCDDTAYCVPPLLRYRATENEWDVLPLPQDVSVLYSSTLVAGEDSLTLVRSTDEGGERADYELDTSTLTWHPRPDDPLEPSSTRVAVWHDGSLYLFARPLTAGADDGESIGVRHDARTDTWQNVPGVGVSVHDAWLLGDQIVVGDGTVDGHRAAVYDTVTSTWTSVPDVPPTGDSGGGMDGALGVSDSEYVGADPRWVLDLGTGQWLEVDDRADSDPGVTLQGAAYAAVDRRLFVFGGERWDDSNGQLLNEAWMWTPPTTSAPTPPTSVIPPSTPDLTAPQPTTPVSAPPAVAAPAPGWTQLPTPPLAPRTGAAAAWSGSEVIVVGGTTFLCPPNAKCADTGDSDVFSDGAAYDPVTNSWHRIADAPAAMQDAQAVAVNGDIFVNAACAFDGASCNMAGGFARYRVDIDRWDVLKSPPGGIAQLVPAGQAIVALSPTDEAGERPDYIFDIESTTWSELPDDPLIESYDRQMVHFEGSLYLFAKPVGGGDITGARYDLASRTWKALPASGTTGYQAWLVDDQVFINPHFSIDGGGVYEPTFNRWSGFQPGPESQSWTGDLFGVVGERSATYNRDGADPWVFDADADQWLQVDDEGGFAAVDTGASTEVGRSLFVFGGERWTGQGDGTLLDDAWMWTPPGIFDGLDIRLELDRVVVPSGGSIRSTLVVENHTGGTVADPQCWLTGVQWGLIPADQPDAALPWAIVNDCGTVLEIPDGQVNRWDLEDFPARTGTGEDLPPGDYLAAIEMRGRTQRITVPVTVE